LVWLYQQKGKHFEIVPPNQHMKAVVTNKSKLHQVGYFKRKSIISSSIASLKLSTDDMLVKDMQVQSYSPSCARL
jgi:hypothetical protein